MEATSPADPRHDPDSHAGAVGRIITGIRTVNRLLHYVAGLILVVLMFTTIVDVIGRTFLNRPFRGTVELTEMMMLGIIYLGFGYAEHEGDHISVDLVYSQVGRTMRLVLTVFNGVFGVAVIGLLTWNLYGFADRLEVGGYESAVLKIPQGTVALVGVFGGVMFVLALMSTAVLAFRSFLKERG